jgi:hypothetical protein
MGGMVDNVLLLSHSTGLKRNLKIDIFFSGNRNVALHKKGGLGFSGSNLPVYCVLDENTQQPSCINFPSFPQNEFILNILDPSDML